MRETPDPQATPASPDLMSRLADGDLERAEDACAAWRADPRAREAWFAYHLIGEALRSEESTAGASRAQDFLADFRHRLQNEPIVLAPVASVPRRARLPRWAAPAAVAAGFAAVAVTLVTLRTAESSRAETPVVATGLSAAGGGAVAPVASAPGGGDMAAAVAAGEPRWQAAYGQLIRDEHLDAYLRAHRGAPEAMPGSASGRFETVVLDR